MNIISTDIDQAVELLTNNELVAIPTETVYGLAANAFSEVAVRKIFAMKQRPFYNPLIVHIGSQDQLMGIVAELPEKAKLLADAFWPGSLTLVLKKNTRIPDIITGGKDTVAVRIPNHPITLELLNKLDFPLAAPSANPFSCISPTKADHVEAYFRDQLKMVLEGGTCKNGIESTIVGFEDGKPILYRHGSISIEEISAVIGDIAVRNKEDKTPNAPGMLARHYAPSTKTIVVDDLIACLNSCGAESVGLIAFTDHVKHPKVKSIKVLSKKGDLKVAASGLYNALHELDKQNLDLIIAEKFPDYGLGKSINDRLERATKAE